MALQILLIKIDLNSVDSVDKEKNCLFCSSINFELFTVNQKFRKKLHWKYKPFINMFWTKKNTIYIRSLRGNLSKHIFRIVQLKRLSINLCDFHVRNQCPAHDGNICTPRLARTHEFGGPSCAVTLQASSARSRFVPLFPMFCSSCFVTHNAVCG
jgi:hypothetical protein